MKVFIMNKDKDAPTPFSTFEDFPSVFFEGGPVGQDGGAFRLDTERAAVERTIVHGDLAASVQSTRGTLCLYVGTIAVMCGRSYEVGLPSRLSITVLSTLSAEAVQPYLPIDKDTAMEAIIALHQLAGGTVVSEQGGCAKTFVPSPQWKEMPSVVTRVQKSTYQNYLDTITQTDWRQLQYQQLVHDQLFHADVYSMPNRAKLTHLGLHIAKYAGRLYDMSTAPEEEQIRITQRTMHDTLAMILAITYSLRMDLSDSLPARVGIINFQKDYARISGDIARACLGYVFLENDSDTDNNGVMTPRSILYTAVRRLRDLAIAVLLKYDPSPIGSFNDSLEAVRRRHFLSSELIAEYEQRMALYDERGMV